MFCKQETSNNSRFLFTRAWITVSSHCDSRGFVHRLCKKGSSEEEEIPPTSTSLWDCHPDTKDYFLAASHAGIALQGLPRLKEKDVADVRRLPSHFFFVPADNAHNLAISFNFMYYKWELQHAEKSCGIECVTLWEKGHRSTRWCAQTWIFIISDNDMKLSSEMDGRGRGGGRVTAVDVTAV